MSKNQKSNKAETKPVVEVVEEEISVDEILEPTEVIAEETVEENQEIVTEEATFRLVTVNVPKLNVRVSPSIKSTIIKTIEQGFVAKVKPFNEDSEWLALVDGGFIMAEYVIK